MDDPDRIGHKAAVRPPGVCRTAAEVSEDRFGILFGKVPIAEKHGVTGPRVVSEGIDALHEVRAQRVEVDVAHQGGQVSVSFDENGLEAVLKQVAGAAVSAVEGDSVARQQPTQQRGQRHDPSAENQVDMIGHERPRVEVGVAATQETCQTLQEVGSIAIITEDKTTLDTTGNDVVKRTGRIEARSARQRRWLLN
jgi:hypothetical protein